MGDLEILLELAARCGMKIVIEQEKHGTNAVGVRITSQVWDDKHEESIDRCRHYERPGDHPKDAAWTLHEALVHALSTT